MCDLQERAWDLLYHSLPHHHWYLAVIYNLIDELHGFRQVVEYFHSWLCHALGVQIIKQFQYMIIEFVQFIVQTHRTFRLLIYFSTISQSRQQLIIMLHQSQIQFIQEKGEKNWYIRQEKGERKVGKSEAMEGNEMNEEKKESKLAMVHVRLLPTHFCSD